MAIPDYREWIVPLLRAAADEREVGFSELNERLADQFGLTAEERLLKTACGRQLLYQNRVVMARTQLIRTGLLRPGTGKRTVAISEQGLAFIRANGTELKD
ncbi:winged helix-turn-helix domain-containing protein [Paenibacillus cymbidii]|uniref:winged helix-turn-helix domain-containing protein n=1 Tax=Paenibacillus cymbidii TaxID=1639034 RepID=UPI00107FDD6E|nr:winged helix-turn-helix domain-containing protein [Paenibacillus cymbidii]